MYVCAELKPLAPDEIYCKRRALRDAVICIGWLKLISVICYALLLILTNMFSKGNVSNVIQVMILVIIPLQIINGVLLFLGTLERKPLALYVGLWLILILAAYNTVLGILGSVYLIRTGVQVVQFILAAIYGFLILSLFTVLCHDVVVIYTYKTLVEPKCCDERLQ